VRICIVTVAGYVHGIGGMQDHTTDLARGLVNAGHEVEVVTARHPEGVREATHAGSRWHFVDAPTRYERLPMRHHGWLRGSASAFDQIHADRPFELVHSESTSALGLLHRGAHLRVPLVTKFHGNYLSLARAALRRARRGSAFAEAKHLVWITGHHVVPPGTWYRFRACEAMVPSLRELEGTVRSYLLRRERTHVVPNGVDTGLFRPRPRTEARAELGLGPEPLLLVVGRLNREKGTHHAIRVLAQLRESGTSDVRLVVVGDGEERDALERLARDLGVGANVTFAGAKPRASVAAYLAAADVFLFPTEREEAAPLIVPQAMACSAAVVASDIGGIPEVIEKAGESGVLVPPGDVPALSAAASRLLEDEALRRRLGEGARRRMLAEYTLERMVERTLAVYELARARHAQSLR
jgi:glycogen synthase